MWGAALARRDEKRAQPGSSYERSELETWRLLIKCTSKSECTAQNNYLQQTRIKSYAQNW